MKRRDLQFRVMPVFSDNMVLQRDKNIHVFGEAPDGQRVTVTLYNDTFSVSSDAIAEDGKWLAILPPTQAVNDCTMEIVAGEARRIYRNIAIGEVWLAGGQSNMEYELQNEKNGAKE